MYWVRGLKPCAGPLAALSLGEVGEDALAPIGGNKEKRDLDLAFPQKTALTGAISEHQLEKGLGVPGWFHQWSIQLWLGS